MQETSEGYKKEKAQPQTLRVTVDTQEGEHMDVMSDVGKTSKHVALHRMVGGYQMFTLAHTAIHRTGMTMVLNISWKLATVVQLLVDGE